MAARLPAGEVSGDLPMTITLGLSVFIVYTSDHLIDIEKPGYIRFDRHEFIKKHRIRVMQFIAASFLGCFVLCFFLPASLIKFGAGMVLFTALYLWAVSRIPPGNKKQALKEPQTSLIYAGGVWASTWFSTNNPSKESIWLGVAFFIITLQSLLVFSHFEAIQHKKVANLARTLSKPITRKSVYAFTLIVLAISISVILQTEFRYTQRVAVILSVMTLVQSLMFANTKWFLAGESRRIWGELVFLIPLLVL